MLQIAGAKLLDYESLLIDILSEGGRVLQEDVNILKSGGGEGILKGNIKTPNGKFKIKLKGKLSNGQNFTRMSQLSFLASNIVMVTIRAGNDYTATVRNRTAPIKVYFFSNGDKTKYSLIVSTNFGFVSASTSNFELAKGANTTISLTHTLPFNAPSLVGKLVKITVKTSSSRVMDTKEHQIQMMYVP